MEPLFSAANAIAIAGWIALLFAPRRRMANWWLAGLVIPALLSALYALLLAVHAPGVEGGFSSLAAVAALFRSEGVLLAGWVHYLAFDLFLGAWICRRAAAEGISPWIARLCLPPTFLAGPIGLLLFLFLRALLSRGGDPPMTALVLSGPSRLFAELDRRQKLLARAGWASLALLLLCLAAMTVDARLINGVSVWTKPAKFAASFVAWYWTLAWAWGVLDPAASRGATARLVLWGTLAAGAFEMGWIGFRAALGQPSHFATDALGAVMYQLMGAGAVTLVALAATLGVLVLRRGDAARQPPGWRFAIGWGLVLTGILGGVTGAAISTLGTPHVGGALTDAAGLPPFYWSRSGGDLRIAHFLGVHAMQALPALALLLPGASTRLLACGAAGWAALTLTIFIAALAGAPLP